MGLDIYGFLEFHPAFLVLIPLHQDARHFDSGETFPLRQRHILLFFFNEKNFVYLCKKKKKTRKMSWGNELETSSSDLAALRAFSISSRNALTSASSSSTRIFNRFRIDCNERISSRNISCSL